VWINPENTDMGMARVDEFCFSSVIRYEGARHDDTGRVVNNLIANKLTRKVAGRQPVQGRHGDRHRSQRIEPKRSRRFD
jgi:hypothetical protein